MLKSHFLIILRRNIFTEAHNELRSSLRKLIEKEINPYVNEWEAAKSFPAHKVFKKLGDAGFLGVCKPEEFGGLALDYSYSVATAAEMGHIECGGVPMAIGVQTDMATPALAKFGDDEVRNEFLKPSISGDYVACVGVSEPGAGSDVAAILTNAKKQGDDYIINGRKMWITSGLQADWMCTLVNTSTDKSIHRNKSLICIPLNSPGINRNSIDKIGMNSSDTAEISLEDVRVPQKWRIGEEGMGFTYQMLQFQEERLYAVAAGITPLEKCIEKTIEYTRDRKVFGQSLLNNQVIHFKLAELQTEIEALKSLLHCTIEKYVNGQDVTKEASMGKLKIGRLGREVADTCLQFWGGMGYTSENYVSRIFRDARLWSIGGGADEVMLSIICKYMGTLPNPAKK